ncbi:hypothetical protein KXV73_004342 [Aspergillus fumigatus]|nr:hypothetical protein KXV73_004342 [Aspergillus fumigatus]
MRLPLLSFFILPLYALPTPSHSPKPPFFLLAGDSTTAKQSSNGGGWGDGFLNTTLFHGASGLNYGHNGATTVSFRAGGDWETVLSKVAEYKDRYAPFVTIQFGHNDQKPAANISLAEYTRNLEQFVSDYYHLESGRPARGDNCGGEEFAIGPDKAYMYNLNPEDRTHLNAEGSIVFGGMVAELIDGVFAGLKKAGYVRVDPRLKRALDQGVYYWPDSVDES